MEKKAKFEKLSRDNPDKTIIVAGSEKIPVSDLERESVAPESEVKKKLRSVEDILEKNY